MKKLLILLTVLLVIAGCSKDEESNTNDDSIMLSEYSVRLFAEGEHTIHVLSKENSLGLLQEDSDIAKGVWMDNGKSILIKAESVGKTSIFISDIDKPHRSVEIKVFSEYFSGNFEEIGEKAIIKVQAQDKSIEKMIRAELQAIVESRAGTLYSFNGETNKVEIDYSKTADKRDNSIGNYECDSGVLNIHIEDNTDKYYFRPIDFDSAVIELEFLDLYRTQYPEAYVSIAMISLQLLRQQTNKELPKQHQKIENRNLLPKKFRFF